MIDQATIEAVRQAADLVELVGGRVELRRRGGRWWGCCPFHEERTPSFSLIPPDFRRYFCFGCGASGDAITWMMEREGAAGFQEAVEALAERAGVPLRYERASPEEEAARRTSERRLELLGRAATFFAGCLWSMDEAEPARAYLAERGFARPLLERYRVGYAPASGSALASRALRQGFSRDELAETGLARAGRGGAADFFTGRIMFPITDGRGRTLGFGGRVMPGAEGPKYINSPEGPRFRKRELLFGLHLARPSAAKLGWVAVVEGYTDVLAMASAGVETAVACMGTSLTGQQLREVKRIASEVRLCFDADAAGEGAAWRTVEAGAGIPLRLSALRLPAGTDPGDLAAEPGGLERLRAVVEAPEPLVVALVRSRCARAGAGAAERDAAFGDVERLLAGFPPSLERAEAVRMATGLLGLPPSLAARLDAAAARPAAPAARRPALGRDEELERSLLALALALPDVGARELAAVPAGTFALDDHRRAAELIVAGAGIDAWPDDLQPLAAELRARTPDAPDAQEVAWGVLRLQERGVERRIARAREAGDEHAVIQLQGLLGRVREALRG